MVEQSGVTLTPWMTVRQFCEIHQICRRQFDRLEDRPETFVFGGRIMLTVEAVKAWRDRVMKSVHPGTPGAVPATAGAGYSRPVVGEGVWMPGNADAAHISYDPNPAANGPRAHHAE